jgi:hypothetical protein
VCIAASSWPKIGQDEALCSISKQLCLIKRRRDISTGNASPAAA